MILNNNSNLIANALLITSLVIGPMQLAYANTVVSAHTHTNTHKEECKHSDSENHSSAGHHAPSNSVTPNSTEQSLSHNHTDSMAALDLVEQDCECKTSCSTCCGGHATVVLLDFGYNGSTRPHAANVTAKIYQYNQIFLPVAYHPPAI